MTGSKGREGLLKSAMKAVRIHGLDGLRTQQITQIAGVSAGNLYTYFSSKEELLRVCFEEVDQEIAALFSGLQFTPEQIREGAHDAVFLMWSRYFRWLVDHPDETVFYFAYRTTSFFPEYEKTRDTSWFGDFVKIFTEFNLYYHIYEKMPPQILWTHILSVTQFYAKQIIEGSLPGDDETVQAIFRIVMYGVGVVLQKDAP